MILRQDGLELLVCDALVMGRDCNEHCLDSRAPSDQG